MRFTLSPILVLPAYFGFALGFLDESDMLQVCIRYAALTPLAVITAYVAT